MSKITVKSEFFSDLRRFPVNTAISFKDFVQTVSKLYKLDNIRLKYRDEEGDSISITNDEELIEAIEYAKNNRNLLRIIVTIGPNSSLLESWIVVEKLPDEVREICNDIKSLSNQLRISRENIPEVEAENNSATKVVEMAPTVAQFLNSNETNRPKDEQILSKSVLSAQLPSWGKNSMYSEDFVRELNSQNNNNNANNTNNNNNNTNNNNNAGLLEGQRTDLVFQNKNEKEEKPKSSRISQVVSENSASIVKDLKALTSKIASLVILSGTDIPLDVKDDLIQTNMKLAEMTIANCQTYSNNALETCNQSSAMALNFVNSALDTQKKQNVENEVSKKNLAQVCDTLRHDTIESCTNLSNSTAENCMKGANNIRDLIMNL